MKIIIDDTNDHYMQIGYFKAGDFIAHSLTTPAFIYHDPGANDGIYQSWWKDGVHHREDGPATIGYGMKNYFLNNKQYSEEEYWEKINEFNKNNSK